MATLSAQNLKVVYEHKCVLSNFSFTLEPGMLAVMLGPNGAGKTTALRACLGLEPLAGGKVEVNGYSIKEMNKRDRALHLAYLSQDRTTAWPVRVREVVALGRFSYGGALDRLSEPDQLAINKAMEACSITGLKDRLVTTLSGGELARVHIARALATHAPVLLADEPIAALDPYHQFRILNLIREFTDQGGGALVVLHDIVMAARYATHLIWMRSGQKIDAGRLEDTLNSERIHEIFGVEAIIQGRQVTLLDASDSVI